MLIHKTEIYHKFAFHEFTVGQNGLCYKASQLLETILTTKCFPKEVQGEIHKISEEPMIISLFDMSNIPYNC